jgi:hypothetical protein
VRPDPTLFRIIPSRARVTPRAFFAAAAEPVASAEEAARATVSGRKASSIPSARPSWKGSRAARRFEEWGEITLKRRG